MPIVAKQEIVKAAIKYEEMEKTPVFTTVGEVLAWARSEIARLSGMTSDSIKLDLKIEA